MAKTEPPADPKTEPPTNVATTPPPPDPDEAVGCAVVSSRRRGCCIVRSWRCERAPNAPASAFAPGFGVVLE